MHRVFDRCPSQRDNRRKRTLGPVVCIGGNDHHRSCRTLLMSVDRIEATPIDLAPFNYHCSSLKSVSETRSQTAISPF